MFVRQCVYVCVSGCIFFVYQCVYVCVSLCILFVYQCVYVCVSDCILFVSQRVYHFLPLHSHLDIFLLRLGSYTEIKGLFGGTKGSFPGIYVSRALAFPL